MSDSELISGLRRRDNFGECEKHPGFFRIHTHDERNGKCPKCIEEGTPRVGGTTDPKPIKIE